MKEIIYSLDQVTLDASFGTGLLVIGALFTAAVGVLVFSFYIDDYWVDADYRKRLRWGRSKQNS